MQIRNNMTHTKLRTLVIAGDFICASFASPGILCDASGCMLIFQVGFAVFLMDGKDMGVSIAQRAGLRRQQNVVLVIFLLCWLDAANILAANDSQPLEGDVVW